MEHKREREEGQVHFELSRHQFLGLHELGVNRMLNAFLPFDEIGISFVDSRDDPVDLSLTQVLVPLYLRQKRLALNRFFARIRALNIAQPELETKVSQVEKSLLDFILLLVSFDINFNVLFGLAFPLHDVVANVSFNVIP